MLTNRDAIREWSNAPKEMIASSHTLALRWLDALDTNVMSRYPIVPTHDANHLLPAQDSDQQTIDGA